MLVKLAFVMQRLKKYLKKFCHDQQRWGGGTIKILWEGHSCYEGGHKAHGGSPQSPPPGKTLVYIILILFVIFNSRKTIKL